MEAHTRLLEALCGIFWEKTKEKRGKKTSVSTPTKVNNLGGLCFGGFTECAPQFHHWSSSSLLKTTYSTEVAAKQTGQG